MAVSQPNLGLLELTSPPDTIVRSQSLITLAQRGKIASTLPRWARGIRALATQQWGSSQLIHFGNRSSGSVFADHNSLTAVSTSVILLRCHRSYSGFYPVPTVRSARIKQCQAGWESWISRILSHRILTLRNPLRPFRSVRLRKSSKSARMILSLTAQQRPR